jgi:hypothetical protein
MRTWRYSHINSLVVCAAAILFLAFSTTRADDGAESPLGSYRKVETYCGAGAVAANPTTIPQFGCFLMSFGHVAEGVIADHHVRVIVDKNGQEAFEVNGITVSAIDEPNARRSHSTNVPTVHVAGVAGYNFCLGTTNDLCPASITIYARNDDKTILFMVSECLPPNYHTCVLPKEGWDYLASRLHKP